MGRGYLAQELGAVDAAHDGRVIRVVLVAVIAIELLRFLFTNVQG